MLFTFITLWIIGTVLLAADPRSSVSRWISAVAFSGGSGALAAVLGDDVKPYVAAVQPQLTGMIGTAEQAFSLICHYGMPYSFLMFAMAYAPDQISDNVRRKAGILLLLPIAAMFGFRPVHPVPYHAVVWWALPYVAAGCWLLVRAYRREPHFLVKRNRMITCIAVLPSVLFATVTIYLLPLFDLYERWRYNAFAIALSAVLAVYFSSKYGFLGIRVSVQKQRRDYTLRAIMSGTAILNHAIKNDIGKIQLYGENLKRHALDAKQTDIADDVDVILASGRHILQMIHRIQDQTQNIVLKAEWIPVRDLVESTLAGLKPVMAHIDLKREYGPPVLVQCDRVHLAEVLNNVMMNAVEAMPTGGKLSVKWYETKRSFVLEISDTGSGIDPQHVNQIFDPFFTTKSNKKTNFGLGLTYCYNVVKRHGGSMGVRSELGQGTTFFIQFPRRKTRAGDADGKTRAMSV